MQIFDFSFGGPKADNQDSVYTLALSSASALALVADGVGGMGGGKAASLCVLQAAQEAAATSIYNPFTILQNAHAYVNALTIPQAATTASVVYFHEMTLTFAHTGDSRIYVLRNNGIATLTSDQTEVALLITEGVLNKEAAKSYRRRNILTHAIEKGQDLQPQIGTFVLESGDRVLLLTDGVYKLLEKIKIRDMSIEYNTASAFGSAIQDSIRERLIDDSSMVIIDI